MVETGIMCHSAINARLQDLKMGSAEPLSSV